MDDIELAAVTEDSADPLTPETQAGPPSEGEQPSSEAEARDAEGGDAEGGDAEAGSPEQGEQDSAPARRVRRLGPGAKLDDEELLQELAALLFASPDPLSLGRLVELLRRPPRERVREALVALAERLGEGLLPIELREIGGGYRLFTAAWQGETVGRLAREQRAERITPAALETLAIVAYRQPVTKAEIEAIRGVQAGPVLRSLVDRGLVKVVGRADQPGAPLQYGTSRAFLDHFGLSGLQDLPRDGELVGD